ncbi:hypothetical protein BO78DRAFT_391217 [Aspergillus sclerotiicarbonarius CBS 121057]|uniref:Uncharacterized protein n=1 Tax=Aspergillus sclerotiicarbonarius (strain CBS 121057 / IBT 28362) TaxID=1448318 RepID=A0A319DUB1_ASPSB|nr:hypothetical protein BO78DRAFT_391217 [Aspergillus sclerotiicarbonarius CBS 121057]
MERSKQYGSICDGDAFVFYASVAALATIEWSMVVCREPAEELCFITKLMAFVFYFALPFVAATERQKILYILSTAGVMVPEGILYAPRAITPGPVKAASGTSH